MFNFQRWCEWTQAEGDRLGSEGFIVDFKSMRESIEKAGLEVSSASIAAVFQFWGDHSGCGHGLADIDVMDIQTKKVTMVCTAAEVTDDNFPTIFRQLLDTLGAP
jgi:hypothetical protein